MSKKIKSIVILVNVGSALGSSTVGKSATAGGIIGKIIKRIRT